MNAYEVFGIENAVLILEESRVKLEWPIATADRFGYLMSAYLTRGVDYLCREVLTAVLDDLAECVLNRGIVAVHEMSIHELDCERGFA